MVECVILYLLLLCVKCKMLSQWCQEELTFQRNGFVCKTMSLMEPNQWSRVEEPFKLYTYDLNDLALEDLCGFFLLDALSCSKATELVPSSAVFFLRINDSTWSYHELSLSRKGHQLVEGPKRTQQSPRAISWDTCRLNRYHLQQRCKEMGWVDPNISHQGHQTCL